MEKHDLDVAPFHVRNIFDDADDIFWFNNTKVPGILDGHAPTEREKTIKYRVLFMKFKSPKAWLQKAMLQKTNTLTSQICTFMGPLP